MSSESRSDAAFCLQIAQVSIVISSNGRYMVGQCLISFPHKLQIEIAPPRAEGAAQALEADGAVRREIRRQCDLDALRLSEAVPDIHAKGGAGPEAAHGDLHDLPVVELAHGPVFQTGPQTFSRILERGLAPDGVAAGRFLPRHISGGRAALQPAEIGRAHV